MCKTVIISIKNLKDLNGEVRRMAPNKSLSTLEVAEILHVSKSTIYELIRRGDINSYKVGRKVRFTQDDWTPISPDPAMSRASSR